MLITHWLSLCLSCIPGSLTTYVSVCHLYLVCRVVGIGSGLQTFSGQAYGAHQWPLLGVILQRATIICWLTALLPLALWTQAHRLLLLLGEGGCAGVMVWTGQYWFVASAADCIW